MGCSVNSNQVAISTTEGHCPIGEITGNRNIANSKIPVISCEGACIRGEIARLAANIISRKEGFGRGCHGELITVPDSAIAKWIKAAQKVLLIDGCFLRCHGRILENLIAADKLVQFDALSFYKKYNDIFDVDDVPEAERKQVAQSVAEWVLANMDKPALPVVSSGCSAEAQQTPSCCS
jgi:uncharacterized metal-binding protein